MAAVAECSGRAQSAADRAGARDLLELSAPALAQLVCSYLALQPQQEAATPGRPVTHRQEAAAAGLVQLADMVLCSLELACSNRAVVQRLQPEALLELEHALFEASRGSASCCAWMPGSQVSALAHLSCLALKGLAHVFAQLHVPPPPRVAPPPMALPLPESLLPHGAEAAGMHTAGSREAATSGASAQEDQAGGLGASRQPSGAPSPPPLHNTTGPSYADAARRGRAAAGGGQPTAHVLQAGGQLKPPGFVGWVKNLAKRFISP